MSVEEHKVKIANPCGAWCFVLGAGLNALCMEDTGHEGDHRTEIEVYVEPKSKFIIYWSLTKDEPDHEPMVVTPVDDSAWAYATTPTL